MPVCNEVPETAVKVYANKWVATVIVNAEPDPEGFRHVYCTTIGDTLADAIDAAQHVLQAYAWGRTAFIRVEPEGQSDTDFDTKTVKHRGIVRFSYKLEQGIWHHPDPAIREK